MSGQEFTREIESTRKALNTLLKDIQYRDQVVIRNEPTYTLDAEIKGQFVQITEQLQSLEVMYETQQKKAKEFNLMQRDLDKRRQALDVNIREKDRLKKMYEESLGRRIPNSRAAEQAANRAQFQKKHEAKKMSKEELLKMKEQQQQKQQQAIDGLIGTVRQMKGGQKNIREELQGQQILLDKLEAGMDDNMEDMSKVKRNMMKLLESSSYWCLILVIIIQIAGIVCNLMFWPKR